MAEGAQLRGFDRWAWDRYIFLITFFPALSIDYLLLDYAYRQRSATTTIMHQHQDDQVGPTVADVSSPKYQGQKMRNRGCRAVVGIFFFTFIFIFTLQMIVQATTQPGSHSSEGQGRGRESRDTVCMVQPFFQPGPSLHHALQVLFYTLLSSSCDWWIILLAIFATACSGNC